MKTANILVIYNRDPESLDHVTEYCDKICKKYGCNNYVTDVYWLENLKKEDWMQIAGLRYEGIYLIGCFTAEEVLVPLSRHIPQYKEVL